MEICYDGKTVRAVAAKYTSNTWFFEIPDDLDFIGHRDVQDHLYAKTIFVGGTDTIDNYIEVDKPKEEEE